MAFKTFVDTEYDFTKQMQYHFPEKTGNIKYTSFCDELHIEKPLLIIHQELLNSVLQKSIWGNVTTLLVVWKI